MNTPLKQTALLAAIFIGLCFFASPSWAEGGSPESVAEHFVKSYYMLDSDMATQLSEDALTNDEDVNLVDLYLRLKDDEARNRGHQTTYLRMFPILMKTHLVSMDDEQAVVQVETTALRSINPLYRAVGYIFCLLQEHEFDTTLTLVKEDGQWKVGPGAIEINL